jgi:hypothetical protein
MQIHDRTTRLDRLSNLLTARWQPIPEHTFILVYQVFELPVLCCQCVKFWDIEFTELLDVNGSPFTVGSVIVLGVVLVDLCLFGVFEAVPVGQRGVMTGGCRGMKERRTDMG